jgi:predicted DNA-binding transcriptional regulator AlpA
MEKFLTASETAAMLGISVNYFYKLRCESPDTLPPAIESILGRKIRARWSVEIVKSWLSMHTKGPEQKLSEQKAKMQDELRLMTHKRAGRPRKSIS